MSTGLASVTGPCKQGYYCSLNAIREDPTDGVTGDVCPAGRYCSMCILSMCLVLMETALMVFGWVINLWLHFDCWHCFGNSVQVEYTATSMWDCNISCDILQPVSWKTGDYSSWFDMVSWQVLVLDQVNHFVPLELSPTAQVLQPKATVPTAHLVTTANLLALPNPQDLAQRVSASHKRSLQV